MQLVKDISASYDVVPRDFIEFKEEIYFVMRSEEAGEELWKTNGTEEEPS